MKFDGADTYPVGVLRTAQNVARAMTSQHPALTGKRTSIARREIRSQWRYLAAQARRRNWRAIRNAFNGYLAEHDGHSHNCGRGWTKRSAERRAERLCREARA